MRWMNSVTKNNPCPDCPDHDTFYGCMNHKCHRYQEAILIEAEDRQEDKKLSDDKEK